MRMTSSSVKLEQSAASHVNVKVTVKMRFYIVRIRWSSYLAQLLWQKTSFINLADGSNSAFTTIVNHLLGRRFRLCAPLGHR